MPAPTDRLPDVRSLIYEIERLRCAAMELREATDDVMNNAWEDGAREERQKVVAWLRKTRTTWNGTNEFVEHVLDNSIFCIERGEHLQEDVTND
jgi:hypothetical protein